jgi:hypothetical protein
MSYIGTKIFFGVCLNSYLSLLIVQKASVWLDKTLIEDRNRIIEEIRKTAAK